MKAESKGLYVHIPFCQSKCNYCDFSSFPSVDENTRGRYISNLICEIKSYKQEKKIKVDTVFFGGGTPSLLSKEEFVKICKAIFESFDTSQIKEFTIEANPKTLTREKLLVYKSFGVDRLSIGLQSIHDKELKILGRIHNFDDFKTAYDMALSCGFRNINVDVMYGIPEQTKESFAQTLTALTSLKPTHISAYGLILEEKTKFWEVRNTLNLPSEDDECDMYELACGFLRKNGYLHYEISNYALSACQSKHNLKYWKCEEYIGVGVAAHSYLDGKRYSNSSSFSEYLTENRREYIYEKNRSLLDEKQEYVMLRLRLDSGISLSEYEELFGESLLSKNELKLERYISLGYMKRSEDRIALTEKGFYVSNSILSDFM